jgi:hypothetical protein
MALSEIDFGDVKRTQVARVGHSFVSLCGCGKLSGSTKIQNILLYSEARTPGVIWTGPIAFYSQFSLLN